MHSYGHNLIGRSNGMSGFVASDIIGVPALLGPLQNNGGRTLTHIPLAGSPAIDQGTISPLLFDQRGRRRTADIRSVPNALGGNGTDIGAVEVDQWMGDQVVARVGNNILLSFNSDTGMVYGVQRRSDIRFGAWFTLPGSVNGNGSSVTYVHTNGAGLSSRFYRVFEQP